jgi:hypothetical protein
MHVLSHTYIGLLWLGAAAQKEVQISVFISCNLSDLTLVQLKFFIHQRAPLCRLSCESQICYKWLLLEGTKGERKTSEIF